MLLPLRKEARAKNMCQQKIVCFLDPGHCYVALHGTRRCGQICEVSQVTNALWDGAASGTIDGRRKIGDYAMTPASDFDGVCAKGAGQVPVVGYWLQRKMAFGMFFVHDWFQFHNDLQGQFREDDLSLFVVGKALYIIGVKCPTFDPSPSTIVDAIFFHQRSIPHGNAHR